MANHDVQRPAQGSSSPHPATIDVGPVLPLLAEMVAARLAPQLCGAQQAASSGDVGGRPRLLRTQEDAAEASGLAPTEFKKRLRTGDVPANYGDDSKRPKSFDAEVLRLWALGGYPGNFDRARPAEWIAWLYEQFGMTPTGLPLEK